MLKATRGRTLDQTIISRRLEAMGMIQRPENWVMGGTRIDAGTS